MNAAAKTDIISDVDFESCLASVSQTYQTLTGNQRLGLLHRLVQLCSARELYEFSQNLDVLLKRDFVRCLPSELTSKLMTYLDVETLLAASQVCRKWNDVISSEDRLWRSLCIERGFSLPTRCPLASSVNGSHDDDAGSSYKRLFLAGSSHLKRINDGSAIKTMSLAGHTDRVMALYYYKGKIATGSDDRTVRIWNCDTGSCLSVIDAHSVTALKFDDVHLVTASFDNTVARFDVRNGRQIRRYVGHVASVFAVDYDVGVDFVVSGSADGTVKIWSFAAGQLLRTLPAAANPSMWITSVRIILEVRREKRGIFRVLWSDGDDVYLWTADDGMDRSNASAERLNEVTLSPRGNGLVGVDVDGSRVSVVTVDSLSSLATGCQATGRQRITKRRFQFRSDKDDVEVGSLKECEDTFSRGQNQRSLRTDRETASEGQTDDGSRMLASASSRGLHDDEEKNKRTNLIGNSRTNNCYDDGEDNREDDKEDKYKRTNVEDNRHDDDDQTIFRLMKESETSRLFSSDGCVRAFLGSGESYDAFIVERTISFVYATRTTINNNRLPSASAAASASESASASAGASASCFDEPLMMIPLPTNYRESIRGNTLILCDRDWLDGIHGNLSKQILLAVSLKDNTVIVLKFL